MLRRVFNWILITVGVLAAAFLLAIAGVVVQRPSRQLLTETLFQGVQYSRRPLTDPRLVMLHIVEIDLTQPGVSFLVTPGTPNLANDHEFEARRTTTFLHENGLQVAINGDFFSPFEANTPFSYYPREGDPVSVNGFSITNGTVYATPKDARPVFCVFAERVMIEKFICAPDTLHAISGNPFFFENGALVAERLVPAYYTQPGPRTVVATDARGQMVWLLVIDGRQPGYSLGMGLDEVAEVLDELGADAALNLDGGGSTTLVVEQNGRAVVLNSPVHTGIPLRERPIANHLGVYAAPLTEK